ncbi:hypothetical protein BCY86_02230 [Pajaroellobacter abortibovis]|uniref:Uncharacterized protein n=1 Tax=Pajaroellobacter abortibovis TaxID=1882918 RepID=A0A1L6MVQ2_9BACT|nr:hypothetical protein BCY86_02230 [Pajaroellobacter abortibovis]
MLNSFLSCNEARELPRGNSLDATLGGGVMAYLRSCRVGCMLFVVSCIGCSESHMDSDAEELLAIVTQQSALKFIDLSAWSSLKLMNYEEINAFLQRRSNRISHFNFPSGGGRP